jgi:hypothetical protein
MTRDEFLDKQYELSVQAGMNQRYHQKYTRFWRRLDTAIKIITAAAAVVSAMLASATMVPNPDPRLMWGSLILAVVTTIAAVALNVLPFGGYEKDHRDLFRQWTDIREDLEALLFDCDGDPSPHNLCELKKLDAKAHRICGQEPSPNDKVIRLCFDAEQKSCQPAQAS